MPISDHLFHKNFGIYKAKRGVYKANMGIKNAQKIMWYFKRPKLAFKTLISAIKFNEMDPWDFNPVEKKQQFVWTTDI